MNSTLELIVKLTANLIPLLFGILAFRNWIKNKLSRKERIVKLGFRPFVLRELIWGLILGTAAIGIVFFIEYMFNLIGIVEFQIKSEIIKTTLILIVAAALEEFIFRSLFINGIRVIKESFYLELFLPAIFFGLVHISNPNATWLSILSTAIGGIMYGLAFLKTDRLYLPTGLHFSWNFAQACLFGFPLSGFLSEGFIVQENLGSTILTGGNYGPEGGLIGIAARLLVIVTLIVFFRKK
jgi:membrane protease YdiL (CAAX protease family)